jgi:hypothetical protein
MQHLPLWPLLLAVGVLVIALTLHRMGRFVLAVDLLAVALAVGVSVYALASMPGVIFDAFVIAATLGAGATLMLTIGATFEAAGGALRRAPRPRVPRASRRAARQTAAA